MIAKKNSRYDLERKRTALFAMGLLVAGSFTLAAFTYDSPVLSIEKEKREHQHSEITYQLEETPKDEVIEKKTQDRHEDQDQSETTVDADAAASDDIAVSDNTDDQVDAKVGSKDIDFKIGDDFFDVDDLDAEIFDWVDQDAHFVGDRPAMNAFIQNNINYPQQAIELGIQGKVYVSFVVEKDGTITNVQIEKTDDKIFDREAKRIVRSFPQWVPAELKAKKVRTRVRLPIVFTLG
jgi:periplasmic protein TonB